MALRKTQVTLADAIGVTKSTLNEMLHGRSAEQGALARLDLIAAHLETSAVELVQPYDSELMALSTREQTLLTYFRSWPHLVQGQILMLLSYFAELLPEEIGHRARLLKLRHVDPLEMTLVDAALDRAVANTRRKRAREPRPSHDATHRTAGNTGVTGRLANPQK